MKFVVYVILLFAAINADVLVLDRWPVLETISQGHLNTLFGELQKTTFPIYSHNFTGFIFPNILTILNFQFSKITPRFEFMSPTFYPSPDDHTFTITLPLGFHVTGEFDWMYNWFVIPVSGHAMLDTDIYDFTYNVTLTYYPPKPLRIDTNLAYRLIPFHEVQTFNFLGLDSLFGVPSLLMQMIGFYPPLLKTKMTEVLATVLPPLLEKQIKKTQTVSLYFPGFHKIFNYQSPLSSISTRQALMYVYGTTTSFPESIPTGEKVSRQYCADQGLLNQIVTKAWADSSATYGPGDLPRDSVYQLTITGLAELIPDVILDYPKGTEVTLTLEPITQSADIKLERINDTHGLAKGFQMRMSFGVPIKPVLNVTLGFDIMVSPGANRRGNGYAFILKAVEATVQKGTVQTITSYTTRIKSNIEAAAKEYLNALILPFLGYALLGDGLLFTDDITPHAVPEFSIANSAICLNLVKIT